MGGELQRPSCVKCRRLMVSHGKRRGNVQFSCLACKCYVSGYSIRRPHLVSGAPCCVRCKRLMYVWGKPRHHKERARFACPECGQTVLSHYHRPAPPPPTGEHLMKLAARVVPSTLPPDVRDDAMQSIILSLLTGEVRAHALASDPRIAKRHINAAFGLNNAYRFISTDAPVGDGQRTFGDLLAA